MLLLLYWTRHYALVGLTGPDTTHSLVSQLGRHIPEADIKRKDRFKITIALQLRWDRSIKKQNRIKGVLIFKSTNVLFTSTLTSWKVWLAFKNSGWDFFPDCSVNLSMATFTHILVSWVRSILQYNRVATQSQEINDILLGKVISQSKILIQWSRGMEIPNWS